MLLEMYVDYNWLYGIVLLNSRRIEGGTVVVRVLIDNVLINEMVGWSVDVPLESFSSRLIRE